MNTLSIRWRLTLWYGMSLVVALGGFCLLILVLARHQSLAHTDAALQEELQELVLEVQLAHSMPDLDTQLHARFFQHDVYDFRVLDGAEKLVFVSAGLIEHSNSFSGSDAVPSPSPSFETSAIEGYGDSRVASIFVTGELGEFIVQAMTPLRHYYAEIHSLQAIMLILLPFALAVASVGGYVMAGRALAPVKQIATVANSITIDRLDRRIEIVNPNDEIGRLASTLNSLIARLENAVTEIQRFTADASHELRTPLAALRSEAESALRSRRSPEEYEQTLTVVVEEAARLGRLTDQLLNLSRLDAGTIHYDYECVRLDALLLDVTEQLNPLAEQRGVAMRISEVQPCEIQGDDIRLSQTFFNILENALKYTAAEGHVEIRCCVSGGSAVVEVQDTGIGIPAEQLPHVFDRFFRGDPSRNCTVGGTGLGLSIARAAVLAHGGTIEICSQPSAGTTVTIRLPDVTATSDDLDSGQLLTAPCAPGSTTGDSA
ncbi:MAG TPA: HAMP domain-containing sensor histidine kinase [Planctomycetaceae bacterium]|nr:HAMP domain-containing sensor histidine kinase [Planctomycetaceae bacterium]HQZ64319.1 HAMP domain-containing sensor histidine kinase [Planctomycetaceae bacterium]